jgi:hypothetical protein
MPRRIVKDRSGLRCVIEGHRSPDRRHTVTDTGSHRETDAHRHSLADAVPLIGQLCGDPKQALIRDAVAALSGAATLVPQALTYGRVAGLATAVGLLRQAEDQRSTRDPNLARESPCLAASPDVTADARCSAASAPLALDAAPIGRGREVQCFSYLLCYLVLPPGRLGVGLPRRSVVPPPGPAREGGPSPTPGLPTPVPAS